MITGKPLPDHLALAIHNVDGVIQQGILIDARILFVGMGQNEHLAVQLHALFHSGRVIAHRGTFKLIVMMLARRPVTAIRFGRLAGFALLQFLPLVKFTHDIAVEIQKGDSIQILVALTQRGIDGGQQMSAGINLVGHAVAALCIPLLDKVAVAVDQLGGRAGNIGSQNDIAVPALGRIILDGSDRNDAGIRQSGTGAQCGHAQSCCQNFQKLHCDFSLVCRSPKLCGTSAVRNFGKRRHRLQTEGRPAP